MKAYIHISILLLITISGFSQDFSTELDVLIYLNGKSFTCNAKRTTIYFSDEGGTLRIQDDSRSYFNPEVEVLSSSRAIVLYHSTQNPNGIVKFIVDGNNNSITDDGDRSVYYYGANRNLNYNKTYSDPSNSSTIVNKNKSRIQHENNERSKAKVLNSQNQKKQTEEIKSTPVQKSLIKKEVIGTYKFDLSRGTFTSPNDYKIDLLESGKVIGIKVSKQSGQPSGSPDSGGWSLSSNNLITIYWSDIPEWRCAIIRGSNGRIIGLRDQSNSFISKIK